MGRRTKKEEKITRESVVHPKHGFGYQNGQGAVGFEFGKSRLNKSGQQALRTQFAHLKKFLANPANKISLSGFGSRPGSFEYNKALSIKRAESVKEELEKLGVDPSRIVTYGFGESDIETKLAEATPPDDNLDDPTQRVVLIDIINEPIPEEHSDFSDKAVERIDDISKNREVGSEIAKDATEPIADLIGKEEALPENIFGADPSDNLSEFGGQVYEKGEEVYDAAKSFYVEKDLKPALKVAGKYIFGSLLDMANSNFSGEVAKQRAILYEPVAKAFAAAIDSAYIPDLNGLSDLQRAIYTYVKGEVSKLPSEERFLAGVYFVELLKGQLVHNPNLSERQIRDFFDGANIEAGAKKAFQQQSKYRIDNSYDDGKLEIKEKDGKIEIDKVEEQEKVPERELNESTKLELMQQPEDGEEMPEMVAQNQFLDAADMHEIRQAIDEIDPNILDNDSDRPDDKDDIDDDDHQDFEEDSMNEEVEWEDDDSKDEQDDENETDQQDEAEGEEHDPSQIVPEHDEPQEPPVEDNSESEAESEGSVEMA